MVGGSGATLQCIEAGVPYGTWQYRVTPVLNTFTGTASTTSAPVTVATAAPVLSTVTAQNPSGVQTSGDIQVTWVAVGGATGYNVYRRVSGGVYDFSSPRNGATPISAGTTYTDPGSSLSPATTYQYVIRAVAATPAVESASSNEQSAASISRPPAPTGVTATAAAAAVVTVAWSSVAGTVGYNVYRRTSAGAYNFAAPLNGITPLAALVSADLTAVNAVSYRYTVRSVILGAGGAQVESANGTESTVVTADSVPPAAPSAVSVTSGGNVWGSANCSVASGSRYVNAAGVTAVGVSATIPSLEVGETVVFSATSGANVPATVAASATTVATLNLSPLTDGTVAVSARTKDVAGNLSAAVSTANVVIKDIVAPPLTAGYSGGFLGLDPRVTGSSECGAAIHIVKTSGGNVGAVWDTTIASGSAFNVSVQGPLLGLGSVTYNVTATDRAGNVGSTVGT
jgi:hypothetical protein